MRRPTKAQRRKALEELRQQLEEQLAEVKNELEGE
jgi:sensor domain CHASE-containing protein